MINKSKLKKLNLFFIIISIMLLIYTGVLFGITSSNNANDASSSIVYGNPSIENTNTFQGPTDNQRNIQASKKTRKIQSDGKEDIHGVIDTHRIIDPVNENQSSGISKNTRKIQSSSEEDIHGVIYTHRIIDPIEDKQSSGITKNKMKIQSDGEEDISGVIDTHSYPTPINE